MSPEENKMSKLDHLRKMGDVGFNSWNSIAVGAGIDLDMLKNIMRGHVEIELKSAYLKRIFETETIVVDGTSGEDTYGHGIELFLPGGEQITFLRDNPQTETTEQAEVVVYELDKNKRPAFRDLFLLKTKPFTEAQAIAFCRDNPSRLCGDWDLFLVDIGLDELVVINMSSVGGPTFRGLGNGQYVFPGLRVFVLR